MIVNGDGKLVGLFTDSDLARLLEAQSNVSLEMPVSQVMTPEPHTVVISALMPTAIDKLAKNQISELPVIDKAGRPLGLIDITDVIGWLPETPDAKDDEPQLIVFPNPESTTNS